MKRYIDYCLPLLVALGVLLATNSQAQHTHKNVVGLEMLGHGFGYTFNYERLLIHNSFFRTTAQLGLSYYGDNADTAPLWIPITINQLHPLGELGIHIEMGAGKIIRSHVPIFTESSSMRHLRVEEWIMRFGFRYQHPERRMLFKIAYTPFLPAGGITHWGAMGFGFQF
ncbi:MAG: hypothetical protein AAGK47_09790 [Bacteroidota bacterium]